MRISLLIAVFAVGIGLTTAGAFAQSRASNGGRTAGVNARTSGLNAGSSSGSTSLLSSSASSSSGSGSAGKSIFDIAASGSNQKKEQGAAGTQGRSTVTTSPFGVTGRSLGVNSNRRRWAATCKVEDFLRTEVMPPNSNFSFSGTITNIVSDTSFTIVTMFASVNITVDGAQADVPVTYTVVVHSERAASMSLREKSKKSFSVDGNYVYFMKTPSGYQARVVDNSLTEPDEQQ